MIAVDSSNPLRSVAPTVDADVLVVLADTRTTLTGAQVHRLAGRSYAQVRHALHRLVGHGLVLAEQHGQAFSYELNRDHVLAPAVMAAAGVMDTLEARLRACLSVWSPTPIAAILFGSFARRDGNVDSDIDVLIVRDDDTPEDHVAWVAQRYDLARDLERWTGNTAQIVEVPAAGLAAAVTRGDDLIDALRRDGRSLIGPDVHILLAAGLPR
jgi:predicted nucleotidyltransferase